MSSVEEIMDFKEDNTLVAFIGPSLSDKCKVLAQC